ncbi:formate dehydrogenase accessory sulfurtransferase FdhD [bacterium]|nr:formate dehydrogenase accessory sulfurtransferase FdhD [bacterium]
MNSLKEYTIHRFDGQSKKIQDSVVVEHKETVTLADGTETVFAVSPSHLDLFREGVLIAQGDKKIKKAPHSRCSNNSIIKGVEQLSSISELFNETGAVHIAALLEDDKITRFYDDISRTSALYKLLGSLSLTPQSATKTSILLTSRINAQLMDAVIKSGISSVAAISAPTDKAIDMAKKKGVFLAGFVRKGKMNIYCEEFY